MNIIKIIYLTIITSLAITMIGYIYPINEVKELSHNLQKMIQLSEQTQPGYSSYHAMQKEYDYLIYQYYKEVHKKYAHLTVDQWRKAYNTTINTSTIKNLIKQYWNHKFNWDNAFDNSIDNEIAQFFIWLDNELNILSHYGLENLQFSQFTLKEIDQNQIIRYFIWPETLITVEVNDNGFKLYPANASKQKEILHALYNILTYDVDYAGIDDYYKQYNTALKSVGHYTVSLWWNALNARTEKEGKTIADLSTKSWYGGANNELKRMKYVLDIAIHEGKGNITYQELLNTLESFYSTDNQYRNSVIDKMIEERNHLRSLS